ncbi:hypothetical protein PIB30_085862 [Stylosanthes scabra]|uniref:MULE transposase domain-containing protein n=1 Tax=Stylosanthes scabra TaxID=79078 RepID=A0ABU6QSI9_9FABA|nr:hypothetical protein [Stylosanthes scabra]
MFQIHWNTRARVPLIELYVDFEEAPAYVGEYDSDAGEHREITWYEYNSDSEDDFEASCRINDENENFRGEVEANTVGQVAMDEITWQQQSISGEASSDIVKQCARDVAIGEDPFGAPSFMRMVDFEAMNGPEFGGHANNDHSKLDSDTIAEAIKPLVQSDPTLKVYGDLEASYGTLPVWYKAMCDAMKGSVVNNNMETLPCYEGGTELEDVNILHGIFGFSTHASEHLDIDGNQNIVPVAFALIEGETASAWDFFLTNLRRYVVTGDGVGNLVLFQIGISLLRPQYVVAMVSGTRRELITCSASGTDGPIFDDRKCARIDVFINPKPHNCL